MSSSQTESASSRSSSRSRAALGARGNWWGNDDREVVSLGHVELAGVSREEWVAGKLLRGPDATFYCPQCYHERDRSVPLSDPADCVPPSEIEIVLGDNEDAKVEDDDQAEDGEENDDPDEEPETITVTIYADHRRHRHCPARDCGYVSCGGILADRKMGEFLEIVRAVLDEADLPSSRRNRLAAEAQSRKARGWSDEENVEKLLGEVRWGADE